MARRVKSAQLIFEKPTSVGRFVTFNGPKFQKEAIFTQQVHGNHLVSSRNQGCRADGIVEFWPKVTAPLQIVTADCLPILLIGTKGVAFIHAGWRGVHLKIHTNKQLKKIGPRYCFIGPSIGPCCFEVTEEFKLHFPHDLELFTKNSNRLYFPLQEKVRKDLKQLWPQLIFEDANLCTYCHLAFHSYRRNATSNRNYHFFIRKNSAIMP